jgi:hypothetical protein
MVRWRASWWVRSAVLSYAADVAGIVVAAVVSSRVSVTVASVAAAAAVLTAFGLLVVVLLLVAARHSERLWVIPAALFLAAPALFLAGLLVAAQVVPGFDVDGAWGYLILLVTTFGASEGLSRLAGRVAPVTPESA